MATYEINIDRTVCIACGSCYSLDAAHFEPDQHEGKSTVAGGVFDENSSSGTFDDGEIENAREAESACPVTAITVNER